MANSVEAFWKSVREIKLDDIRKSAFLTLRVALVGGGDELDWLQDHFRGATTDSGDLRRLNDCLRLFELDADDVPADRINECTLVCVSPAAASSLRAAGAVIKVPIFTIGNEGEWLHFKKEILDSRWDLHISLGRNLPGLRADVIEYTIVNTSCINAEIAIFSGVAASIPGIPTYPLLAFGDWLLLTKNQIMMAFRLAGACGLAIDLVHLKTEVLSVIGAGIGWRSAARTVVGLVPVAGIPLKGVIAYAGTYAVGKAIARFFVTGTRMGQAEELKVFRDAMDRGREFVQEKVAARAMRPGRFRRRGNVGDSPEAA